MWGQKEAEADRATFTEDLERIWESREEGRHEWTVINVNKGLDVGMCHVSSGLLEKPGGPHRAQDGGGAEAQVVVGPGWEWHHRAFRHSLGGLGSHLEAVGGRRRKLC